MGVSRAVELFMVVQADIERRRGQPVNAD